MEIWLVTNDKMLENAINLRTERIQFSKIVSHARLPQDSKASNHDTRSP